MNSDGDMACTCAPGGDPVSKICAIMASEPGQPGHAGCSVSFGCLTNRCVLLSICRLHYHDAALMPSALGSLPACKVPCSICSVVLLQCNAPCLVLSASIGGYV